MIELLYFSGKDCGVCQVLKPKLKTAVEGEFLDQVVFREIDIAENQETAAQNMVFTLPVVIINYNGKELKRFVRSFGVHEVLEFIHRLIQLNN